MRAMHLEVVLVVAASLVLRSVPVAARSDEVMTDAQVAAKVVVRDVRVRQGVVSGLLVNRLTKPLRDVRLLIRYQWVWANERKPGDDNPGRVAYYTVHQEVPPEISVQFTYNPNPPLPSRSDGHFETLVEIVGYTEVEN